jgi:hypothetical protein
MKVYIVGEDEATREIIKRVLNYCSDDFAILMELPARGSQLKQKIPNFNELSKRFPVILLMDLDDKDCAPTIFNHFFRKNEKNDQFIFNIVIDEAEAWLMADRKNFASYFRVPTDSIPIPKQYRNKKEHYIEMSFPYKSSYYLVKEIIPLSRIKEYKEQMIPKNEAKKAKEYNSALTPFIRSHWDVNNARLNSDSLNRMIIRIENLIGNYKEQ